MRSSPPRIRQTSRGAAFSVSLFGNPLSRTTRHSCQNKHRETVRPLLSECRGAHIGFTKSSIRRKTPSEVRRMTWRRHCRKVRSLIALCPAAAGPRQTVPCRDDIPNRYRKQHSILDSHRLQLNSVIGVEGVDAYTPSQMQRLKFIDWPAYFFSGSPLIAGCFEDKSDATSTFIVPCAHPPSRSIRTREEFVHEFPHSIRSSHSVIVVDTTRLPDWRDTLSLRRRMIFAMIEPLSRLLRATCLLRVKFEF